MSRHVKVAVIGGGAAGIATGVKLLQAGFTDFEILEQSDGPGGTWWDNSYPGSEVDIHSYFYSFSFMDWDWSRTHATQPEILAYMKATVAKFGLEKYFRYRSTVTGVTWRDDRDGYEVGLADGHTSFYDAVITCVGFLNNPRYPDWPGLEDFEGTVFHTSRWNHEHQLAGERVAVVGTGSSASQVVPSIAPIVSQLTVFQREPGWVLPKGDFDYSDEDRARFRRSRLARVLERFKRFRSTNRLVRGLWREGTKLNTQFRQTALDYLQATIEDEVTRAALTPDFAFGCKRTIQSTTFLPAFNRDNVRLVPNEVVRTTAHTIVTSSGEYEVDTLILATGFQAQRYLGTVPLRGRDGVDLQEYWRDDPMAFVGSMVPRFPNFFMVYGPNTNGGGSGIFQIEQGAALAVRMISRLRRGVRRVEVTESAYRRYNRWLDGYIGKALTAQTHCHNYYFSPSGRNVTQWPASHVLFAALTRVLPFAGVRSHRSSRTVADATVGQPA